MRYIICLFWYDFYSPTPSTLAIQKGDREKPEQAMYSKILSKQTSQWLLWTSPDSLKTAAKTIVQMAADSGVDISESKVPKSFRNIEAIKGMGGIHDFDVSRLLEEVWNKK